MINETTLRNVLKGIKEHPDHMLDIIDSFSDNQFKTKDKLLKHISNIINSESNVVILGCWYGSILIPNIAPKVNKIIAIDLNDKVVRIGKNRFFKEYSNVSWSTGDAFVKQLDYSDTNLIINTSCEHMPPMKEWPFRKKDCYFALTSNNMYNIDGHINCVNSLNEFKSQLPDDYQIIYEEAIEDTRGTRYMLIGKFL